MRKFKEHSTIREVNGDISNNMCLCKSGGNIIGLRKVAKQKRLPLMRQPLLLNWFYFNLQSDNSFLNRILTHRLNSVLSFVFK